MSSLHSNRSADTNKAPPVNIELLRRIKAHAEAGHALIRLHYLDQDDAGNARCSCHEYHAQLGHEIKRPCAPRNIAKHPVHRGWELDGTEAFALFSEIKRGASWNVGWRMGRQPNGEDLVTIDVDDRDKFEAFRTAHALPETFTQRTGGGGVHMVYRVADASAFANGVDVAGLGFDIRAEGGQIVLAGSISAKGPYTVALDVPITDLPEATAAAILASAPKSKTGASAGVGSGAAGDGGSWDAPVATDVERGRAAVLACLPAVSGENGQGALMKAIAAARGWGLGLEWQEDGTATGPAVDAVRAWDAEKNPDDPWFDDPAVWRKFGQCSGTPHGAFALEAQQNRVDLPELVPNITQILDQEPDVDRNTDAGNARAFEHKYGSELRFCAPLRTWYRWDGKHWKPDARGDVMKRAKAFVRDMFEVAGRLEDRDAASHAFKWAYKSSSVKGLNALVELAKTEGRIPIDVDDLDADPYALNVQNGIVDLRTGKLRQHAPEALCTKIAGAAYVEGARSDAWEAALDTWTGGDRDLRDYLRLTTI